MKGRFVRSEAFDELAAAVGMAPADVKARYAIGDGRLVGLLYGYVPEELFTAAGVLPYRIHVSNHAQTALSEGRFNAANCGFVRRAYDAARRGELAGLDGLVTANACDHERRLFDNLLATMPAAFSHFVVLPKKSAPEQVDFYARELRKLADALGRELGARVDDEALHAAIRLHNESRRLQRALSDLRCREKPPLTGSDVLTIMLAAERMPREHYNKLLRQLLADCTGVEGPDGWRLRVLVYGGDVNSVALLAAIEAQGALIAGDWLGIGYRACRTDVAQDGDPYHALAASVLLDRPEPRFFGTMEARQELVEGLMRRCGAQAVILPAVARCDYWEWEQHNFAAYAKRRGLPLLTLGCEYGFNERSAGQLSTRVAAFVETHGEA